jgi:hypothetical protein
MASSTMVRAATGARERHEPARDARDVEQVVDEARHVAYLAADDGAALAHPGFVQAADAQQVGGGADRRQRVAQLVRQHREEFVLAPVRGAQLVLGRLALGDVAEERDEAAVRRRIGAHLAPDLGAVRHALAVLRGAGHAVAHHAAVHAPRLAVDRFGPHVPVVAPDGGGRIHVRDAQAGGIHLQDGPVAVDQHEAFRDRVEDRAAAVALLAERALHARQVDGGPDALGRAARQRDFGIGPRMRPVEAQQQECLQAPASAQRDREAGLDVQREIGALAGGRARVRAHVGEAHDLAGAPRLREAGAEGVDGKRVAGNAGQAGPAPVARDGQRGETVVDFAVQHARHAQLEPQQGAAGTDGVVGGRQRAQRVRHRQFECGAALGLNAVRRLDDGAIHAGDAAVAVVQRRIREREPRLLAKAVTLHRERQVFEVRGFVGQRAVDDGHEVGPDLGPDLLERRAERGRMLGAEDRGVGVVVQEAQVRSPGDEHRERGADGHRHGGGQFGRPGFRRTERRRVPVVLLQETPDVAVSAESGGGTQNVSHGPILAYLAARPMHDCNFATEPARRLYSLMKCSR